MAERSEVAQAGPPGQAPTGTRAVAGVVGGLAGGVVFGLMMQMMTTPDGMPMMVMVAMVVGSMDVAVGWIYHLFNSIAIGVIFGLLLGSRVGSYPSGLGWGAGYGFIWWILGGLILMPVLLGMEAFAPLMMPEMVPVALGSLAGHLIYGVILGLAYVAFILRRESA